MLNNVHFSEDEEDLSYHVEILFTNRLSVKAGMGNWRMRGMIGNVGIYKNVVLTLKEIKETNLLIFAFINITLFEQIQRKICYKCASCYSVNVQKDASIDVLQKRCSAKT